MSLTDMDVNCNLTCRTYMHTNIFLFLYSHSALCDYTTSLIYQHVHLLPVSHIQNILGGKIGKKMMNTPTMKEKSKQIQRRNYYKQNYYISSPLAGFLQKTGQFMFHNLVNSQLDLCTSSINIFLFFLKIENITWFTAVRWQFQFGFDSTSSSCSTFDRIRSTGSWQKL